MSYREAVEQVRSNREKELDHYKKTLNSIRGFFPLGAALDEVVLDTPEMEKVKIDNIEKRRKLLLCEFPYDLSAESVNQALWQNYQRQHEKTIISLSDFGEDATLKEVLRSDRGNEIKTVRDALECWTKIKPNRSKSHFIKKIIDSGIVPTTCQSNGEMEEIEIDDLPLVFRPDYARRCIEDSPLSDGTKKVFRSHLKSLARFVFAVGAYDPPVRPDGLSLDNLAVLFDSLEKGVLDVNSDRAFRQLVLLRLLFSLPGIANDEYRKLKWNQVDEKNKVLSHEGREYDVPESLLKLLRLLKDGDDLFPGCPVKQNINPTVVSCMKKCGFDGGVKELKNSLSFILLSLGVQDEDRSLLKRR